MKRRGGWMIARGQRCPMLELVLRLGGAGAALVVLARFGARATFQGGESLPKCPPDACIAENALVRFFPHTTTFSRGPFAPLRPALPPDHCFLRA
ncbi:hypothetical protein B0J12DRAFT_40468 [Macrophomina phaseolina]|uniref:Secreted protein n=1 Tax=Macrophomina phaseolina TaxID=35725 RepID=A0ABQ8GWE0_9PEZI|nr:hypothetical protein B0J12DRAFT_40468 [Macrophomina phaseolina]